VKARDRYLMLDVWMALGGDPQDFETWIAEPKRYPSDAWAQLLAAIRGDRMEGDHHPEPGLILNLVRTCVPDEVNEAEQ